MNIIQLSFICCCLVVDHSFTELNKGVVHMISLVSFLWLYSSVQSLSRVWLFATPWTAACQASLSIIKSQSLPKLMSIESVMLSNHLILCHPLLLLPSIFPSIRVFSNESVLHIIPKYWNFSFSISPSNEYSELISFRMDWLDLLAVQGTLKSLLQHHSSKAWILWRSAFFTVQLSHPYMTIGKTIALIRWTFVGKLMSLLLNMLSRLVITFLPRSKRFLNFMAAITICSDFGAPKNKVWHCFHCFLPGASEAFHSWQRSWGRRLGIRKGGIESQESPWIFSSIYPPKNQSLPTLLLCALTSDFTGGRPPPPSSSLWQRVNLQLQLIKFLGIRSV